MANEPIGIELSRDEALVLHDWLANLDDVEVSGIEPAAQRALWNLEALLEKSLTEPFHPDYRQKLKEAKARLANTHD
ncbi:MAG: hypothetical protein AAGF12_28355 [Myxococcota bacterium]